MVNGATEYDFQAYRDLVLVEADPDFHGPLRRKAHAEQACKAAGVTNEAVLDGRLRYTTALKDNDAAKI